MAAFGTKNVHSALCRKIINVLKHSYYVLLFQMKSLAVEVRIILQRNLLREASAQDELEVPPGNVI